MAIVTKLAREKRNERFLQRAIELLRESWQYLDRDFQWKRSDDYGKRVQKLLKEYDQTGLTGFDAEKDAKGSGKPPQTPTINR